MIVVMQRYSSIRQKNPPDIHQHLAFDDAMALAPVDDVDVDAEGQTNALISIDASFVVQDV